jgi:hypothetical protein
MSDKDYLERESQALIEKLDDRIYELETFDPLLNSARWEIVRLREIVYEQTIELGLRGWEINQLKEGK